MDIDKLKEALELHAAYLDDHTTGVKADLRGAAMSDATGQHLLPQRYDGYQFFLVQKYDETWFIRAGCRAFTIPEYREHVKTYSDETKARETTRILDFAQSILDDKK